MRRVLTLSTLLILLSTWLFVSCGQEDTGDPYPLLSPKNLEVVAGDAQVELTWIAPESEYVSGYHLSWTPDAGSATVERGISYTATGLTNGTIYTFSVKAVYERGVSDALTGRTTPKAPVISYAPCTELTAVAGFESITLSWQKPEPMESAVQLTGYTINQLANNMQPRTITIDDPDVLSQVVDELKTGIFYTFSIVANYGDKGASQAKSVTTAPVNPITAIAVEGASVAVVEADRTVTISFIKATDLSAVSVGFTLLSGASLVGTSGQVVVLDLSAGSQQVEVEINGKSVIYTIHAENGLEKKVGIAYTTWHRSSQWSDCWGTPELGYYYSNDRQIIRQHGEWLAYADVDFVFIDWSNDIDYIFGETEGRPDFDMIEKSVPLLFEEWKTISNAPKIAIMLGCPDQSGAFTDGRMQSKINQVYDQFIADPNRKDQYYTYLGKPLIVVYVGTPSPFSQGLPKGIQDDRFTFRYITGYVTEQGTLMNSKRQSIYGYWSWEDRREQSYTLMNDRPETCTITAASREQTGVNPIPAEGRKNGETFRKRWQRARELGVSTALVVSWNEWGKGEQPSVEVSKDLEPSVEYGRQYLELLKEEVAAFKQAE